MRTECYFCATKTVEKLIDKFKPHNTIAEEFVFNFSQLLIDYRDKTNPELATATHRLARKMLKNNDLYQYEKSDANNKIINLYDTWRKLVNKSKNPLFTAAKLAVIGNIIDYGAHLVEDDFVKQIYTLLEKPLAIDDSNKLFDAVKKAKSILYLADNNGEIIFDKLFIETLNHNNITVAVRDVAVINDVTIDDVKNIGLNNICNIISNGYDAPSTILKQCSSEFINIYNNSDLIISKGQGNFEGLINEKKDNLFFMLMAKCTPMANMLGVDKGDLVIKQAPINT
jgi:uncharacterized protein with ATP-grasp and redox domains